MESAMERNSFEIALPKFKSEYDQEVTKLLEQNGLLVTQTALPGLGIEKANSHAIQFTYFEIDEKGATAAATTVTGAVGSAGPASLAFEINRPFVYVLKSRDTSAILMMGVVTDL